MARCKARLVANGNQQAEGLDYTETFSPVIKQPTLSVILSLAVNKGWPLRQCDVANAFLHGLITEDVYMRQPLGYKDSTHPEYVCKLSKALCGLRQAPRAWYALFSSYLVELGFHPSKADTSLFIFTQKSNITLVLIYLDDIVITGSDSTFIQSLILQLSHKFVVKDLGSLHCFLGIEVHRTAAGLFLSQVQICHKSACKSWDNRL